MSPPTTQSLPQLLSFVTAKSQGCTLSAPGRHGNKGPRLKKERFGQKNTRASLSGPLWRKGEPTLKDTVIEIRCPHENPLVLTNTTQF